MFSRRVSVDLALTPQQALDATGRLQGTNPAVVAAMPKGRAEEELFFFRPRPEAYRCGIISDEALEKEFDFLNLKPASPFSLAKANQDDPALADSYPNGTHFKDASCGWCFASFYRRGGERCLSVTFNEDFFRYDDDWNEVWWIVGVRR